MTTAKRFLADEEWKKNPSRALVDMAAHEGSLSVDTVELMDVLLWIWAYYLPTNKVKRVYYEAKNRLKDLGISIPPPLRNVEMVIGWPKLAVSSLADRVRFDGFQASDPDTQTEIDAICKAAHFSGKHRQALNSELISGCNFVTLSKGDSGEPPVIITTHSAEDCAGIWDERLGRLRCGLAIMDYDNDSGAPREIALYTPLETVHVEADGNFASVDVMPHKMNQPLMVALAHNPTESHPLGQSRITGAVRSLTDCAVREALRTEISAEFFTSPQKYLLGVDGDPFEQTTRWQAYVGNIFTISQTENGTTPQFGQLSQGTMEPHISYMRALANRFAAETHVPLSQLGVMTDNPSSAEALEVINEPLIIEAENLIDDNSAPLSDIARLAIAIGRGVEVDALTDAEADITPRFKNPARPSVAAQVDAAVKLASVNPSFAQTSEFWQMIGFDAAETDNIRGQITEQANRQALAGLMAGE